MANYFVQPAEFTLLDAWANRRNVPSAEDTVTPSNNPVLQLNPHDSGVNSFSKTQTPCDCGWLSLAINEPNSPIKFDKPNNSIIIESAGGAQYPMYHCPFCGGRFPDSSKPIWVPLVPDGERERVEALVKDLKNPDEIITRLGSPDYDQLTHTYWEREGKLVRDESIPAVRNIEYYALSDWFNVEFYASADGSMRTAIVVKSLSPRPANEPAKKGPG